MPETGKQARNKKQNAVISDDLASYLDRERIGDRFAREIYFPEQTSYTRFW
jgi:hypothetical protein